MASLARGSCRRVRSELAATSRWRSEGRPECSRGGAFGACVKSPTAPTFRAQPTRLVSLAIICLEPSVSYGTLQTMSTEQLTPTACLVLGLLAREGPSTPYDLKRHVAATLGHFWSFPHSLLYGEPARLAGLGLLSEEREDGGRRRRIFTITPAGLEALREWLGRPSREPTELRDTGLLQLFFADLGPPDARLAIAAAQLAIHRAKLQGVRGRSALRTRIRRSRSGTSHRRALAWGDRADGPPLRARRCGLLGGRRWGRRSCRCSHGPGTRAGRRGPPHPMS